MNLKMKAIIFWALIAFSIIFLLRTVRESPKDFSLWTLGFVVPFVILTNWFFSRFSGPRKRTAMIALLSAFFGIDALCFAIWNFVIRMPGDSKGTVAMSVSLVACLFFCIISVRSFLGLRKSQFPT